MQETFIGDEVFQIKILKLMTQDITFYLTAKELIKPEYFTDKSLAWYFQEIIDHATDFEVLPDPSTLEHRLKKAKENGRVDTRDMQHYMDILINFYNQDPIQNQEYIQRDTVEFCKAQATKKVFMKYGEKLSSATPDTYKQIIQEMEKIIIIGDGTSDMGIKYFLDFPENIRRREAERSKIRIPCGINSIDSHMNGGLRAGQIGVWLGTTNVGKSVVLPHCAKFAVINGFNVAYYTLELNEEDVCERFDASFSAVPVYELESRSKEVQDALHDAAKRYGDRLRIKYYPTGTATVNDIYLHIRHLQATGFKPDLIVVDHADLLKPSTNYGNLYDDLGGTFKALRGLAGLLKIPVWTATQTNRAGYSQETADLDVMGDSFQKAQIADVVISINSTPELYANKILQLLVCKNRNGKKWVDAWIRTNYERMWFVDPTAPEVPEDLKEKYRKRRKSGQGNEKR